MGVGGVYIIIFTHKLTWIDRDRNRHLAYTETVRQTDRQTDSGQTGRDTHRGPNALTPLYPQPPPPKSIIITTTD